MTTRSRPCLAALVLLATLFPLTSLADPVLELCAILGKASDYKQRVAAALSLARRGDARAVPALIAALKDRHEIVQGVAAAALGKIGDPRARPALEALLGTARQGFLRSQVREALAALTARSAPGRPPASLPAKGGGQMEVEGTLGSLDAQQAQAGVNARLPIATACYTREQAGARYLGGKLELRFRVATDGKVKWLQLERSDLGSYAVEQCVLAAMGAATFAVPDGGEAEFTQPLTFGDANATVLDPQSSEIATQLHKDCKLLLQGKLTAPAGLLVTLYVDAAGEVASVGLSANGGEIPSSFAEPFIKNLKARKLERGAPGSGHGKLTYPFSCAAKPARRAKGPRQGKGERDG